MIKEIAIFAALVVAVLVVAALPNIKNGCAATQGSIVYLLGPSC